MVFPRQVQGIPLESPIHELRTDVIYDEVAGVPLRFDHYRPRGMATPTPCVVFVHGGAWAGGDPSQAAGHGLHFARRGIATVSISYRLAPEHHSPAALDDVRRGLRWVRAHAAELDIDPERIVLLGLSAGAHLAVLAHLARDIAALDPELPTALRDVPEDVLGIMAHYGPYDLGRTRTEMVDRFLGPRAGDAATIRLASPHHHAERASVPVLLIHGTADNLVSWRESSRLHEALTAAGRASELLLLQDTPHAFQVDWHGEANRRANATMDAFLDRVLAR